MLETRKVKLISSELMDYFFKHNILQQSIRINLTDDYSTVIIAGHTENIPEDFEKILKILQTPRRLEVEEYYEDLLGLDDYVLELDIIAAMVDVADATFLEGRLILRVIRYL